MASNTDDTGLPSGACGNSSDDIDSTENRQGQGTGQEEETEHEEGTGQEGKRDDFSKKTWKEDLVLSVQGRQLYVNSAILALSSPVFSSMFEESFKEEGPKTLELQERYDDLAEYLRCMYPGIMKPVTLETVFIVAPLAYKYKTDNLVKLCETFLENLVSREMASDDLCLVMDCASSCQMEALKQKCVAEVTRQDDDKLDTAVSQLTLSPDFKQGIAEARTAVLKENNLKLTQRLTETNTKCAELEKIIGNIWLKELAIDNSNTVEIGAMDVNVYDDGKVVRNSVSIRGIVWKMTAKTEKYQMYSTPYKKLHFELSAAGDATWQQWNCKAKISYSVTDGKEWVPREFLITKGPTERRKSTYDLPGSFLHTNGIKVTACILVGDVSI